MSLTKEEILNGLYNAGLITLGAVGGIDGKPENIERRS